MAPLFKAEFGGPFLVRDKAAGKALGHGFATFRGHKKTGVAAPVFDRAVVCRCQTQPVGLGSPPYLVIGFIGPVIHILKMSF